MSVVEQEVERCIKVKVRDEDMLVAGKEGDASEEEEIELVVDEDQKDIRKFLQSEEGTNGCRTTLTRRHTASYSSSLSNSHSCLPSAALLSPLVHTQMSHLLTVQCLLTHAALVCFCN